MGGGNFPQYFHGVRKHFVSISWGMKFFFGILGFHPAPLPDIKNDWSLSQLLAALGSFQVTFSRQRVDNNWHFF